MNNARLLRKATIIISGAVVNLRSGLFQTQQMLIRSCKNARKHFTLITSRLCARQTYFFLRKLLSEVTTFKDQRFLELSIPYAINENIQIGLLHRAHHIRQQN